MAHTHTEYVHQVYLIPKETDAPRVPHTPSPLPTLTNYGQNQREREMNIIYLEVLQGFGPAMTVFAITIITVGIAAAPLLIVVDTVERFLGFTKWSYRAALMEQPVVGWTPAPLTRLKAMAMQADVATLVEKVGCMVRVGVVPQHMNSWPVADGPDMNVPEPHTFDSNYINEAYDRMIIGSLGGDAVQGQAWDHAVADFIFPEWVHKAWANATTVEWENGHRR
jgi:hypothetical protein